MSTVHYKFKNAKSYSSVVFDGPYITLSNLKEEIGKLAFGTSTEVALEILNAETMKGDMNLQFMVPEIIQQFR
jgi:hypothetical protein